MIVTVMKKDAPHNPKQQLKAERLRHGWSQQEMAEKLAVSVVTINRWERGVTKPSPYFRLKLCALFGKSAAELGLELDEVPAVTNASASTSSETSEQPSSLIISKLSLPFHRNALFTGRETILSRISTLFRERDVHIVALTGLGGIGKTQTAIEYAYRFRQDYKTIVWLHAENNTTLTADCTRILRQLHLLRDEQQREQSIEIMQHWLAQQHNLLLILDNVEDGQLLSQLLPAFLTGHVLLTTRTQVTGTLAQQVDLQQMTQDESVLLLLRRAKLIAPDARMHDVSQHMRTTARELCSLLDGLPLALDQAGAYIEETGCNLSDYVERYSQYRKVLLARRGADPREHPASVVTTISLCMQHIEQRYPEAAELLRCCAFFPPDNIDETLLRIGASALGPVLANVIPDSFAFDAAIAQLRTLSLLYRNTTAKTLTVHRLVQTVLQDGMEEALQRQWAEQAVSAVCLAFSDGRSMNDLLQRERYILQASHCVELITQWRLQSIDACTLLYRVGHYYTQRGSYAQAEKLLTTALPMQQAIDEKALAVATTLNTLGTLREIQGRYAEAEQAYIQAHTLQEEKLAPGHPNVLEVLTNSGRLAMTRGNYGQAQSLLEHVLRLKRERLGENSVQLIPILHLVGSLYRQIGKYRDAFVALQGAYTLCVQAFGETDSYTIESLGKLIFLCRMLGFDDEAHYFQQHIITTLTEATVIDTLTVPTLRSLAVMYELEGNYTQAEALLRQTLAICEYTFGNVHPETAESLRRLSEVYRVQDKYTEAEEALLRTRDIFLAIFSPVHPDIAETNKMLGFVYGLQERYDIAEKLLLQAMSTYSEVLGDTHPEIAETLIILSISHTLRRNFAAAKHCLQQALAIQKQAFGSSHLDVAATLHRLANLYVEERNFQQAKELVQEALAIRQRLLIEEHPKIQESIDILSLIAEIEKNSM
jgi:tetratricopeptide (TPR) repeat protein/transcriptional regulator with XRE-family HTH domain